MLPLPPARDFCHGRSCSNDAQIHRRAFGPIGDDRLSRAERPARQYRISEKTASAVRQLAAEVNFSPNRVARGLRLNRTESIGVVIPDVSNPFFAGIVRQIALGARRCHYSVIVCDSQETEELEIESLDLLRGRGVEGIVLCPVGRSAEHLVRFEEGDLPLVLADRYFPGLCLPYVVSDNLSGAGGDGALDSWWAPRIACLQGLVGTSPNEDRLRGYSEALSRTTFRWTKPSSSATVSASKTATLPRSCC